MVSSFAYATTSCPRIGAKTALSKVMIAFVGALFDAIESCVSCFERRIEPIVPSSLPRIFIKNFSQFSIRFV